MPTNIFALVSLLIATAASPQPMRPWTPTPQMVRWSENYVPASGSMQRRAEALHRALVSRRGLGIGRLAGPSLTAEEAFTARRVDCVGFAFLYLGMARRLGLPAYFVLSKGRAPAGRLVGARLLESHLAVGLWDGYDAIVVDHSGVQGHEGFRPIEDNDAEAILWSNRGVRAAADGDCPVAMGSLRHALLLTREDDIVRNLAVVSSRCSGVALAPSAR